MKNIFRKRETKAELKQKISQLESENNRLKQEVEALNKKLDGEIIMTYRCATCENYVVHQWPGLNYDGSITLNSHTSCKLINKNACKDYAYNSNLDKAGDSG